MRKKFTIIIIILAIFLCIPFSVNAGYIKGNTVNSYADIPESITVKRAGVVYDTYDQNDPLDLFDNDSIIYGPALQYIDKTGTNILDRTYVFCVSQGKTGADTGVSYSKTSFESGLNNDIKIREIIKAGFQPQYENDANLRFDYYTTQIAIWVIQGTISFPNLNPYNPKTADEEWKYNMFEHTKQLIQIGKNADVSNKSELIAKYKPNDNAYQEVVPAIIYPVKKPQEPSTPSSPSIKENYINISISYKDKCTNEYVENAKMHLYQGNSCNGNLVKSWNATNSNYKISNIEVGTYTICDTTNNYSKTINVNNNQVFEMVTNPETCDIKEEKRIENPKTGIISNFIIILLLSGAIGLYAYAKKNKKFIK